MPFIEVYFNVAAAVSKPFYAISRFAQGLRLVDNV